MLSAWTTRVSNPVCSPRLHASTSVMHQKASFDHWSSTHSPSMLPLQRVFRLPYAHSDPFPTNASSTGLVDCVRWGEGLSTHSLRPVILMKTRPLRLTAAAGTEFAGAASTGCFIIGPVVSLLRQYAFTSGMRRRCIALSCSVQDSLLLPLQESLDRSQFQCGCTSSQTSYRSSAWEAFTLPTT